MNKTVRVSVVHDELGRIVAINRPVEGVKAISFGGDGEGVLDTEIDPDTVDELIASHIVNIQTRSLEKLAK